MSPTLDTGASIEEITKLTHQLFQRENEIFKLRFVVDQSPDSVVITNIHGDIEYVNQAFTKITGYTSDEVKGKNPRIFKSGQNPKAFYAQLWANITSGQVWRGELCNVAKDGREIWESTVIYPIKDVGHNIIAFCAVKEDVTFKKTCIRELGRVLYGNLESTAVDISESFKLMVSTLDNDDLVMYSLINSMPLPVLVYNGDCQIIKANLEATRIFSIDYDLGTNIYKERTCSDIQPEVVKVLETHKRSTIKHIRTGKNDETYDTTSLLVPFNISDSAFLFEIIVDLQTL
jgi:PAS domain S-box-containing protein